jgi:pilus assembly protein CpaC
MSNAMNHNGGWDRALHQVKSAAALATVGFLLFISSVAAQDAMSLQAADTLGNTSKADRTMELYVGSVKTMKFGSVRRIAVGNDSVLAASVLDSGQVLLIPKSAGLTDLQVWSGADQPKVFHIRVDGTPLDDRMATLRAVMASYPGVKIDEQNGTIILSGYVDQNQYDAYSNLVNKFDHTVSVVRAGSEVGLKNLVEFDVKIIEINKQYTKNLGVHWQDTVGGPAFGITSNLLPNNKFGVYSQDPGGTNTSQLDKLVATADPGKLTASAYLGWSAIIGSQLEILEANNAARVLAEPRLSTLSGETAKFLAGGELPVAILNEFGQPVVDYKDYGIKLDISPFVDQDNVIQSKIHAEVSSIDFGTKVNGVPGLLNRSTDSTIRCHAGQTIAISGLVNVNDSRAISKVPLLGSIPVLGTLFKSRDFQQQRTDLLILVTPRLQVPDEPVNVDVQRNVQQMEGLLGGSSKIDSKLME